MTKHCLIILACLSIPALSGCTEQRKQKWEAVAVEDANYDNVWQVCLAALKDRGLEVDRQDRRFGLIVSKPTVGQQFFELWRKDAANFDDLLLSSLHTVRRIVSIRITSPGTMQFEVQVEAQAQRASIVTDQLDNAAEAFEMLSRHGVPASPSQRDYTRPQAEPVWVDIGREPDLEQCILEDISRRLEPEQHKG